MKEQLIKYWERKERQMRIRPSGKAEFFSQAFGALDFAMEILDDWAEEAELVDLWTDVWKPRMEAIMYDL